MNLYLQIFWLFTRVALFSWGGGPGSLALMQRETVAAGWITTEEFADAVALGNAVPGPIAPQVSAFVGYKLAGVGGAVTAAAGTVLPASVLAITMISLFFSVRTSPTVRAMLTAVRPVVVGLLLWTAFEMAVTVFGLRQPGGAQNLLAGWDKLLIVLASFGLLTFTSISPIFIIIAAALLGFLFYR